MIFQWHHVNNINPNITLDQFEETVIFQKEYATDYYEIQYPGLILNIILNRKVNYHLINSYIPSCLFVTVAWLSLFVNPEAIPGRISMVMMTLLTLMAMFSGIRQSTPKVSSVHITLQAGIEFKKNLRVRFGNYGGLKLEYFWVVKSKKAKSFIRLTIIF